MALDDTATKADIVTLIETAFIEKFPVDNPPTDTAKIATAMGEVIAEVVTPLFDALRNDAIVTTQNVTPGINTVTGSIS